MKTPAETLAVTLVQAALHWENKRANLAMFEKKIAAGQEKMEVVLLPEMFNTGFSMHAERLAETMEGETVAWMRQTAATHGIILAGSLIINEEGKFFNRLVWMLPAGECGYYDKRHRFAYAGEDRQFSAGSKRVLASAKGWRLNLQVCYDLRFPVWARQAKPIDPNKQENGEAEYDVLVYVANWPEQRGHAWRTLLQARAIENQCYTVGVNRTGEDGNGLRYGGDSMVVDPMGAVIAHAADKDGTITCSLSMEHLSGVRAKLPFLKDADPFLIGT